MNGTITYKGRIEKFKGITRIAYTSVVLYLKENPNATMDDVHDFFHDGLDGTPKNHFLIKVSDYLLLSAREQDRYIKEELLDAVNNQKYYVSGEFANMYKEDNVPFFVKYITDKGFVVNTDQYYAPTATKENKKKTTNTTIVAAAQNKLKKRTSTSKISIPGIIYGYDSDCGYVSYDSNVPDEDKVPGLARYINEEYERLLGYVFKIMGEVDWHDNIYTNKITPIPVILSNKCPADVYYFTPEDIAQICFNLFNNENTNEDNNKRQKDEDKIKEMARNGHLCRMVGEYKYKGVEEPYIIIYYRNIGGRDFEQYKANVIGTFAHEYGHHMHHIYVGKSFDNRFPYGINLKEAIAEFFSLLYSIHTNYISAERTEYCRESYYSWTKFFKTSFPYANALYFYLVSGYWHSFYNNHFDYLHYRLIEKFENVFELSAISFYDAFDELKK